jgi:hypothetical protein
VRADISINQEGKRIGLKSRNVEGEMGWRYTNGYALI